MSTNAGVRVGASEVVITPPLGIEMAGYYYERRASAVKDDLYARVLVVESAGKAWALVSLDLICVAASWAAPVRADIGAVLGAGPEAVLLCASHTHTGPVVADRVDKAADSAYLAYLSAQIRLAARQAAARLEPAAVRYGEGRVAEGLAFNRRYWMQDGQLQTNPGLGNPDVVRPAGPVDLRAPFVALEAGGSTRAVLFNFAQHPDMIGGTALSADWPGIAAAGVRKALAPEGLAIFTNGASGDINHVDVQGKGPGHRGWDYVMAMGEAVTAGVVGAAGVTTPTAGAVRAAARPLKLPVRPYSDADLKRAQTRMAAPPDPVRGYTPDRVEAVRIMECAKANAAGGLPAEVQVLTVGDVALVAIPGELFVELGMEIRRRSPFPHTIVVALANDIIGYIPTLRAFAEGGYEVSSARMAPEGSRLLVETAIELLEQARARA